MMKLHIGYFYPEYLNLYGDNGNLEILKKRAEDRGIKVGITPVSIESNVSGIIKSFDLIIMGGGPDASQKQMYADLYNNKGNYIREYIEEGGAGLFICGSYQLLGHYYMAADGSELQGLGIFDLYTKHFGNHKPRCIGNVVCKVGTSLEQDPFFKKVNSVGNTLVGFENHGGRTYLGEKSTPLARVISGHGNNSEDLTEGVYYKNSIGTYLHGPFLSKNPHIADLLIAKGLRTPDLKPLEDATIISAHTASLNLKQ